MAVVQESKGPDKPVPARKDDETKPVPGAGLDKEIAGKDAVDSKAFAEASDNRYVGRVDEFHHLRNEAGQLAPEDGMVPDPLADEAKRVASGDPTQPWPFGSARDSKAEVLNKD